MRKIILRLDDICPDMDYSKFVRVRDIFVKSGIKPLIGVVPNNEHPRLKEARRHGEQIEDDSIWDELVRLQNEEGWEVALHGYDHIYKTDSSGILGLNRKSEFAGVPYEEQERRIKTGKLLLESKGLNCIAFMAPAHSFDENTLKALSNVGITAITDGKGVFPYKYRDFIMMPVPYSIYKNLPLGVYSIGFHPNNMSDRDFDKLVRFIVRNKAHIIGFSEGLCIFNSRSECRAFLWTLVNEISDLIMRSGLRLIQIIRKIIKQKA